MDTLSAEELPFSKKKFNERPFSPVESPASGDRGSKVDRRQVILMAALSSAYLILSEHRLSATPPAGKPTSHAAFQSVAPGSVRPDGRLRGYLEEQLTQLGSRLPEVSWPFSGAYWQGDEETTTSWWPWEQKGYWIDGAMRLAIVMTDDTLAHRIQAIIDYTLTHAAPNGYLGPDYIQEPER